jgi:plasmid maintenance system antidote protein VapI
MTNELHEIAEIIEIKKLANEVKVKQKEINDLLREVQKIDPGVGIEFRSLVIGQDGPVFLRIYLNKAL